MTTKNRKKCRSQEKRVTLSRAMQSLALAGLLMAGTAGMTYAASPMTITDRQQVTDGVEQEYTTIDINNGGSLDIARNAKVRGTDVTVNVGGSLTSAKNLHFGNFSPELQPRRCRCGR